MKAALKERNRISAAACLKSKKLIEATLAQRYQTLTQVEEIYSKIAEAVDQAALVQVMRDSTGVLQGLQAKIGGVERVEDVVDELRDEMRQVDEVGTALEAGSSGESFVDEDAVDAELAELERQSRSDEEAKRVAEVKQKLSEIDGSKALPSISDEAQDTPLDASIGALTRLSIDKETA